MNAARALVALYPDPFRDRWGPDLELEIRTTGWRSWPNLVMGIIDMWLHPAIWPAESRDQRHHRAATMAITIAAASWFLTHAVTELDTPLSSGVARAWPMTACTILTLLGLLLVLPYPRPTPDAVSLVLRRAAGRFAAPAVLGAGIVAYAHTDLYATAPALLRPVGLGCWWTALALGAIQTCRMTAGLGAGVAVPPGPGRLRVGLWALAVGGIAPGPILLSASVSGEHLDPLSAASGAGLLVLASAFIRTLHDIRHLPSTG